MKKIAFFFITTLLLSCSSDNDELIKEVDLQFKFSQNWDGTEVTKSDFATTEFTNKLGTKLTIEKLRYLISNITLTNGKGETTVLNPYTLIDLSKTETLTLTTDKKVTEGLYNLSFTFGFNNTDNKDGFYQDLNSASWGVPPSLAGGYHFMQLEGKFLNKDLTQQGFAYHTIRAADNSDLNNIITEDTSFVVDLGTISLKSNATIEIKMNVSEWFKNPNEWNLDELNSMLMPNFEAQKLMSANGKSGAFKLGNINQ